MRTIVVGDIHGCLEEFDELLKETEFKKGTDRLILAGDLVDRGPDSVGVVRRARELQAECVLGNHEEKQIRFRRHENQRKLNPKYKNPMTRFNEMKRAINASLSDEDFDFLSKFPTYIRLAPKLVVVHGGVSPGKTAETEDFQKIIRLRYITEEGKLAKLEDDFSQPPESVFWAERWTGPDNIIYGHNVSSMQYPRIDLMGTNEDPLACVGLDTGCCFGGRLTAAVMEGNKMSFVQVSAKKEYYPRHRVMEEL